MAATYDLADQPRRVNGMSPDCYNRSPHHEATSSWRHRIIRFAVALPAVVGVFVVLGPVWEKDYLHWASPLFVHKTDLLIAIGGTALVLDAMCNAYGLGRVHLIPLWTGLVALFMGGILKLDPKDAAEAIPIIVVMMVVVAPIIILTVPSFKFRPRRPTGWAFLASLAFLVLGVVFTAIVGLRHTPDSGSDKISVFEWMAAIAIFAFVITFLIALMTHTQFVLNSIVARFRPNGSFAISPLVEPQQIATVAARAGEFDQLHIPKAEIVLAVRRKFQGRSDVYITGNALVRRRTAGQPIFVYADVLVVLGTRHNALREEWNLWREGKAPNVVVDIASRDQNRDSVTTRMRAYREMGVVECWQFDLTGQYFDQPLAGYRLLHGDYQPLLLEENPTGALRGHSEELGIDFSVDPNAGLLIYDSSTGESLL